MPHGLYPIATVGSTVKYVPSPNSDVYNTYQVDWIRKGSSQNLLNLRGNYAACQLGVRNVNITRHLLSNRYVVRLPRPARWTSLGQHFA